MKSFFVALVVGILVFELAEHVVLPLVVALAARKRKSVSGIDAMLGQIVEIKHWHKGGGTVFCRGELWSAAGPPTLATGDRAVVREVDGLRLKIVPLEDPSVSGGTAHRTDSPSETGGGFGSHRDPSRHA